MKENSGGKYVFSGWLKRRQDWLFIDTAEGNTLYQSDLQYNLIFKRKNWIETNNVLCDCILDGDRGVGYFSCHSYSFMQQIGVTIMFLSSGSILFS